MSNAPGQIQGQPPLEDDRYDVIVTRPDGTSVKGWAMYRVNDVQKAREAMDAIHDFTAFLTRHLPYAVANLRVLELDEEAEMQGRLLSQEDPEDAIVGRFLDSVDGFLINHRELIRESFCMDVMDERGNLIDEGVDEEAAE